MAKITPLFSSSKGNSFLLRDEDSKILIDCGVTTKRLKEALEKQEIDPRSLDGILITHEHIDHIKGLKVFSKQFGVPIYASNEVLSYITSRDEVHPDCSLISLSEVGNQVADFWVESFITPHDSLGSVGFRVTLSSGRKLGFATDIGIVTDYIREGLMGCEAVVLESNYDGDMLRNGSYPYYLKQRIASTMGHLANGDAARLGAELIGAGTSRIILAHLSQENNLPALAKLTFEQGLAEQGISQGDYRLLVASPNGDGSGFVF